MANRSFNQFFYTNHKMPVLLDCKWVVDDTDPSGVTGLKGPGIQAVYMHTSTTPAAGNPNPAVGYFYIQLQDNYYKNFIGWGGIESPQSGSSILVASAGVVNHTTYVITAVGTTTTAGWQSLGLPVGIAPAVGVPFIATATATATGTGAVQIPAANGAGVTGIEFVGYGSLALAPTGTDRNYPYIIGRFMGPTDSSTTTPIAKAPAASSIVSVKLYLSNSSVLVQGE